MPTVAEPIPDQPLLPKTCSDIVYAEIRFRQSSSLKLYFLMARTVVDSKPEKGFECLYKIIDNVFNNSINYYYVQKEIVITI